MKRFAHEAQSLALFHSPWNANILHAFKESGHDYIVMELVEGRPLSKLLSDEGPLTPSRAVAFFHEVALGLAAAHAYKIVHRDLKAGNLMVTPDGHAPRFLTGDSPSVSRQAPSR